MSSRISTVTYTATLFPTYALYFKPELPMTPGEVSFLLDCNVRHRSSVLLLKAYVDGSFIVTITERDAYEALMLNGVDFRRTRVRFQSAQSNVRGFRIKNLPRNISNGTLYEELCCFGRVLLVERERSMGPTSGCRVYVDLKAPVPTPVKVICLQEVQASHFTDCFQPCMEKIGYRSIYKKKTGSKCDGCAIFFKADMFKLDYCSCVEYFRAGTATLDRDNIGLIAVLRPQTEKLSNIKLCVATTHLLFNPRRGDIKLSQIRLLLAELDKLAFRSSVNGLRTYYPVVLCGDMNAEPFSPLYNFICCGKINFDGMMGGDISGQEEGHNKGRLLTTDLLDLTNVGINSETLYVEGQKSNSIGAATNDFSVGGCSESCSSTDVNCSDSSATLSLGKGSEESGSGIESDCMAFYGIPTGDAFTHKPKKYYLSHPFNFDTSYRHFRSAKAQEVTTQNIKSMCTVDYIFYNLKHKRCLKIGGQCTTHVNKAEGELKLVGNYGLLYPGDFRDIGGLPNACLSSDHLCLISRFFLSL